MCNSKPLASTCNSQLYNSYNNDAVFLKAKVMISEGLFKTILFVVIFRRETWNCTAAALYFTRHFCLFIYFSSVVHVILRQGQTTKTLRFHFKTTEPSGEFCEPFDSSFVRRCVSKVQILFDHGSKQGLQKPLVKVHSMYFTIF